MTNAHSRRPSPWPGLCLFLGALALVPAFLAAEDGISTDETGSAPATAADE